MRRKRKVNGRIWLPCMLLVIEITLGIMACIIAFRRTGGVEEIAIQTIEYQMIPAENMTSGEENVAKIIEITPDDIEEEMRCDELELLAACVEAEAGNQGLDGKRMVADVILNRVRDKDFPDTITEVIKQPYQFSTWWNGMIESVDISEETLQACEMELEQVGWPELFFFTCEGYSKYGTPWKKVGDHYFSTK